MQDRSRQFMKESAMSGNKARQDSIEAVRHYAPPPAVFSSEQNPGEVFGENVFTKAVMQKRLPKPVFKSLMATIEHSKPLDPSVADVVAVVMKDWAMEKGATHYAHVFYPLTHLTAEKHDSFFEPGADGDAIAEFAGKTLTQGEPDASSFPNGGLRATFEARGYTGWDVTSPAYILENPNGNTLCIPTVFISMTGEALDNKTPLLRSQQAMAKQAARILHLFGHENPDAVVSFAGAEQEYFLIDRSFFLSRPDLLNSGPDPVRGQAAQGTGVRRPLLRGHPRAGPCLHDGLRARALQARYPGQNPAQRGGTGSVRTGPDVRAFERRGRPPAAADDDAQAGGAKARHGVPLPREAVRGHQRLGQACQLLGGQLHPGQSPPARRHAARQRPVPGVLRRGDPLGPQVRRPACAPRSPLPPTITGSGANEAPPAIISIFLGDQLADVFEQIAQGGATSSKAKGSIEIGVDTLPVLPTDPGDRNRTSPFAFTGNRFEFRAPGSLQSIAGPMVTINTILAEAFDHIATEIEGEIAGGAEFNTAVQTVLQTIIKDHGAVVFNKDGYADEWQIEAAERGLPNLKTTLDALPELITEESMELFSHYGVFNHREMHSRYEIALEQYILSIHVEAALTLEMANTIILPAALRYQTELATNLASLLAIGQEYDATTLDEVSGSIKALRAGIATLRSEMDHEEADTEEKHAEHAQKGLLPAMASVRAAADTLETLVADDLWPLATYQEMLFIL